MARSTSPASYSCPARFATIDGCSGSMTAPRSRIARASSSRPCSCTALVQPVQRVAHVRVLLEHLAQDPLRTGRVARVAIHEEKSLGRPRAQQPRLQLQRALHRRPRAIHGLGDFTERLGDRELGMSLGELRVDLDRPLQFLARTIRVAPVQQLAAGEVMLVGLEVGS